MDHEQKQEELDQFLNQEGKSTTLPADAAIQAVQWLNTNLPLFVHMVTNYKGSKKQLQRVIVKLALTPLTEGGRLSYPEEIDLFKLGMHVFDNKLVLLYTALREQERQQAVSTTEKEKEDAKPAV